MTTVPPTRRAKRLLRVFLGVHISVTGAFCVMMTVDVFGGIRAQTAIGAVSPAPVGPCAGEIAALRDELVGRIAELPRASPAIEAGRGFEVWSAAFRHRLAETKARCERPADGTPKDRAAVAGAISAVERLLDLSDAHAAHWARHMGPAADEAATAVARLPR